MKLKRIALSWALLGLLTSYASAELSSQIPIELLTPVPGGVTQGPKIELESPVFGLIVDPSEVLFPPIGDVLPIKALAVTPGGGTKDVSALGAIYEIDNTNVASIDAHGNALIVSQGVAAITIKYGGFEAKSFIVVDPNRAPTSLEVFSSSLTLANMSEINQLVSLLMFPFDDLDEGNANFPLDVTYSKNTNYQSSDESVVRVSPTGLVTAVGNGIADITVTNSGLSQVVPVTVGFTATLSSVTLSSVVPGKILRSVGSSAQLKFSGFLSDGTSIDLTQSRTGTAYSTLASSVATVSPDGLVAAAANGVTQITACNSGLCDSLDVKVSISNLTSLEIDPPGGPVSINSISPVLSRQLAVTGNFSDGTSEDLKSQISGASYRTSDPAVASVGKDGLAVFTQPGLVTITASNDSVSKTASFEVTQFSPFPLGRLNLTAASNIKVSGHLAYIAGAEGLLSVVDASNPVSPAVVGELQTEGTPKDLALRGNLVYVANGANLLIADVSASSNPVSAAALPAEFKISGLEISEDKKNLYVSDGSTIKVYDLIADPLNPQLLGSVVLPDSLDVVDLALGNNILSVSQGSLIRLVDVSLPSSPQVKGFISMAVDGLAASGNRLYATAFAEGLHIIDVSNPDSPAVLGDTRQAQITLAAQAALSGNFVIVAQNIQANSHPIFNISNPRSPTFVGVLNFLQNGDATRVDISGSLVYFIGTQGLSIGQIDQESPLLPPSVRLLEPLAGGDIVSGGSARMVALAQDNIGIQRVDFLINGTAVATDSIAPYDVLVPIPAGLAGQSVQVGARAQDLSGIFSPVHQITVNAIPDPLTTVRGQLINGLNNPVAGANVSILPGQFQSTTDQNGRFQVSGVSSVLGDINIEAQATVAGFPITFRASRSPVIKGITDFGALHSATQISGTLTGTLPAEAGPYRVTDGIAVPEGNTLTIAAGAVIKVNHLQNISVHGTLVAHGSPALPVVFTSLTDDSIGGDTGGDGPTQAVAGHWGKIELKATGALDLAHTQIRYAETALLAQGTPAISMSDVAISTSFVGLRLNAQAQPVFFNVALRACGNGLLIEGEGQAFPIANLTIEDGIVPIVFSPNVFLTSFNNVIAAKNQINGLVPGFGALTATGTWKKFDLPYVINNNLVIEGHLTLEPATVVKIPALFQVSGTLDAVGLAAAPIVFTHVLDHAHGGQTMDPAVFGTVETSAGWPGIPVVTPGTLNLEHALIRFAQTALNLTGSTVTASDVRIERVGTGVKTADRARIEFNDVVISTANEALVLTPQDQTVFSNVRLEHSARGLLLIGEGKTKISNLILARNHFAIFINPNVFIDELSGVALEQNVFNGIVTGTRADPYFADQVLSSTGAWKDFGLPYIINDALAIEGSLALEPGVVVKANTGGGFFGGANIFVRGSLVSLGLSSAPVVLTELRDASVKGQSVDPAQFGEPGRGGWPGIMVDPDANLAMAHSNIRFANVGLNLNGTGAILGPLLIEESNTAAIALSNGADVSLSRVTVKNSNQAGISAQNSTFALNLGQIEGNVSGILLESASSATIANSKLLSNFNGLNNQSGSTAQIRDSIISGNQNFGVTNEDPAVTVDATNNFWGSASGPAHASNPEGTGDRVSDNVEFIPFLTTPPPGLSMEGP